jgi:hypothetical protein
MTFDPAGAFQVLNRHGVRYVLIGGLASEFLGAAIATNDIDICYERTPVNMSRLAEALKELHAALRVAGVDEDLPFVLDGRTLAAGDSSPSAATPATSTCSARRRVPVDSETWTPTRRPTTSGTASSCGSSASTTSSG